SCAITNKAMARTAMRPPIMGTTYSRGRSSGSYQFRGYRPGFGVGSEDLFDRRQLSFPSRPLQCRLHDLDDTQEPEFSGEERLDGHFVRSVEDAGGGAAAPGGLVGEVDSGKCLPVDLFEF